MAQLGAQTLNVGTFQKHLLKRTQTKAKRRRALIAGLTLTSMVDMFSLLVIFLLQTFSTSPELIMVTKGVELPIASRANEFEDAPVLSLSAQEVHLDQKLVGETKALIADPTPLMKKLSELRELWQTSHPNEKFSGRISLQADRGLSSPLVSQFMGLLPTQAYSTIQLAVISAGGK